MRRLRALIYGLPPDSAFRHSITTTHLADPPAPATRRRPSSADTIRKFGGRVVEVPREETG